MDFDAIKDVLKFLNWEMLGAIGLIVMAWTQFWKEFIPDVLCCGGKNIPVLKIFILASGAAWAYFIFDVAGVKHTETVAILHGIIGAMFSALGYEILKGTSLGLRSTDDMNRSPGTTTRTTPTPINPPAK
jgi:hypothetical protein